MSLEIYLVKFVRISETDLKIETYKSRDIKTSSSTQESS